MYARAFFLAFVLALLGCTVASAEPVIDVAKGYEPAQASIVLGADGALGLALVSINKDLAFLDLETPSSRPTKLEFMRLGRDGKVLARVSLPQGPMPYGANMTVVTAALPGGEFALFLRASQARTSSELAEILRLSSDGKVLHRASVGRPKGLAPNQGYEDQIYANFLTAAPDGTLFVGGGFSGGPFIPWWGHYTVDGMKLAGGADLNITPGPGITSVAFDSDGGFRVAGSHFSGLDQFDAVLNVYDASGRLKTRKVILRQGGEYGVSIFTDSGLVFIGDSRKNDSAVRFFDRNGTLRRSTPWKENYKDSPDAPLLPEALIADGAGLAGLLGEDAKMKQIVRIDSAGKLAWRSAPDNYLALVRASDGALLSVAVHKDDQGNFSLELIEVAKP